VKMNNRKKCSNKVVENEYIIDCTGDCVVGDEVRFDRAVFIGSWKSPKFSHNETIEGKIISDSYGKSKQQHTFTILLASGKKTMVKGRNLYRNGTMRKLWADESARKVVRLEKHDRGACARSARENRLELFSE